MRTFKLFSGVKPNGDEEVMAVSDSALSDVFDGEEAQPADFFIPGTTGVEEIGIINISGDEGLVDEYFSVKS